MRNPSIGRRRASSRNRTRVIFYVIVVLMLAVIAFSLSTRVIDRAVLMQIYIATGILGVGVVLIDMMGLLGHHYGDETSGHDDGGNGGDDGAGIDHGDTDDVFSGDTWDGHEDLADADSTVDGAAGSHHHEEGVPLHDVDHDSLRMGGGPVLEAIRYLRMFVYFCLGFGLVGLALLTSGRTAQASLLFAGMAGIGTVLLARLFYRLQPGDTGDLLSENELLLEQGTVIVPLTDDTMGKVRIQVGMQVYEPYALAAHAGEMFVRGEKAKVVRVTDECVYVEKV